jgi:flagellar biosynthesis/type III secretory pathway M-ring protein FliF/YscJ
MEVKTQFVKAIAMVVAKGSGVKPQDVVIVDLASHTPYQIPAEEGEITEGFNRLELEKTYARQISNEVKRVLTQRWQTSDVVVSAIVRASSQSSRESSTVYAGEELERRKINATNIEKRAPPGGAPGSDAIKGAYPTILSQIVDINRTHREQENDRGDTRRTTEIPKGVVESVAVLAVIPIPEALTVSKEELARTEKAIKDLVSTLVPTDIRARVNLDFVKRPEVQPPMELAWYRRAGEQFARNPVPIVLFLASLGVIFMLYRMVKTVIEKRPAFEVPKPGMEEELPPEEAESMARETQLARIRRAIRDAITKNPRAVATVLRHWMGLK